jgi:uncharacterized protein (TIGR02265 family)
MIRFTVTSDKILTADSDPLQRALRIPASFTMKGMFFPRLVAAVGSDWHNIARGLLAPPRSGRYLPFFDYPQRDYGVLLTKASPRLFPRMPEPEAVRRYARSDLQALGASVAGSVMLALVGDPASALLRMPDIYRLVLKGGACIAERSGSGVVLRFREFYGALDNYGIGNVEGLVGHYGVRPKIEVELDDEVTRGTYEVSW